MCIRLALPEPGLDETSKNQHLVDDMARTRITREQYGLLVESFRETPGNAHKAAEHAGIHYRTALRAWRDGWLRPEWARPIKDVLEQEQMRTRAKMQRLKTEEVLEPVERAARLRDDRAKAQLDIIEERAREAQGVRATFNNALMMLGNIGQFQKASVTMCKKAAEQILTDATAGNLTPVQSIKMLNALSLISKRVTEQFELSMEVLRKHLGEPEKLVGIVGELPTTKVDGDQAINALGEERLKKAIMDLAQGVDSEEAQQLIEWQVENGHQMPGQTDPALH